MTSPGKVDTGLCGFSVCLLRGDIANSGMDPPTIVIGFDVPEQVAPRGITIGVLALVDQFGFQGTEGALHRGIVPAVCLAAHRLGDGGGLQELAVVAGGILAAADALLFVKQRFASD